MVIAAANNLEDNISFRKVFVGNQLSPKWDVEMEYFFPNDNSKYCSEVATFIDMNSQDKNERINYNGFLKQTLQKPTSC